MYAWTALYVSLTVVRVALEVEGGEEAIRREIMNRLRRFAESVGAAYLLQSVAEEVAA